MRKSLSSKAMYIPLGATLLAQLVILVWLAIQHKRYEDSLNTESLTHKYTAAVLTTQNLHQRLMREVITNKALFESPKWHQQSSIHRFLEAKLNTTQTSHIEIFDTQCEKLVSTSTSFPEIASFCRKLNSQTFELNRSYFMGSTNPEASKRPDVIITTWQTTLPTSSQNIRMMIYTYLDKTWVGNLIGQNVEPSMDLRPLIKNHLKEKKKSDTVLISSNWQIFELDHQPNIASVDQSPASSTPGLGSYLLVFCILNLTAGIWFFTIQGKRLRTYYEYFLSWINQQLHPQPTHSEEAYQFLKQYDPILMDRTKQAFSEFYDAQSKKCRSLSEQLAKKDLEVKKLEKLLSNASLENQTIRSQIRSNPQIRYIRHFLKNKLSALANLIQIREQGESHPLHLQVEELHQEISFWHQKAQEKGIRKFLRTLSEIPSTTPAKSLLDAKLDLLSSISNDIYEYSCSYTSDTNAINAQLASILEHTSRTLTEPQYHADSLTHSLSCTALIEDALRQFHIITLNQFNDKITLSVESAESAESQNQSHDITIDFDPELIFSALLQVLYHLAAQFEQKPEARVVISLRGDRGHNILFSMQNDYFMDELFSQLQQNSQILELQKAGGKIQLLKHLTGYTFIQLSVSDLTSPKNKMGRDTISAHHETSLSI